MQNKRELEEITIDHSADIDYKDFLKIYRNCTNEPYSFSVIKRFKKNFSDSPLQK